MNTGHEFEIRIRKKIPYWSEFLLALIMVCFGFLFILYLMMSPSRKGSDEMCVAYYILVVPKWLQDTSAYSFLGLIILTPVYSISKTFHPALLIVDDNAIHICKKENRQTISINSINKAIISEVKPFFRKERTEVIIKHGTKKATSFLLEHFIQTEELMQLLIKFENIEFAFSRFALETYDEG